MLGGAGPVTGGWWKVEVAEDGVNSERKDQN